MSVYLRLVLFFLKTFFFNPRNNPVFVVLAVFLALFYMEGSLDKYHIALMLYLAVLSHYFIGNMFKSAENIDRETSRVPMMRFFQALPVSGRKIYFSYLLSSTMYVCLTYVLLGLLLMRMMKLPDLRGMQFVQSMAPDGDTITTLTGYALTPRGIPYFVSMVWPKSLLFDSISRIGGGKFWMSLYLALVFMYICVFVVYQQVRLDHRFYVLILLCKIPLGIYLLMGMVFATELILTQNEIGAYSRLLFQHLDIAAWLFLIALVTTAISTLFMSKSILSNMKLVDVP